MDKPTAGMQTGPAFDSDREHAEKCGSDSINSLASRSCHDGERIDRTQRPNVIEYRAGGSMITPRLAHRVMADAFAARHSAGQWAMRIEQRIAVENCAITISVETIAELLEEEKDRLDKLTADRDMTLIGLPISIDDRVPIDTIELHDRTGELIAKITQLAVPI